MSDRTTVTRRAEAAIEYNRHEGRDNGGPRVDSLFYGLTELRDSLFARVTQDVANVLGVDSMLIPRALVTAAKKTKTEIELYQIAESAAAVRQRDYVSTDDDWFLNWLARLRLGDDALVEEICARLASYVAEDCDDRRRSFTVLLERIRPDARRSPLVVYQLFPLAVQIATANAFGDPGGAEGGRTRQLTLLPAIADCRECRGGVLDNGEGCHLCGNPLWKYEFLTASD